MRIAKASMTLDKVATGLSEAITVPVGTVTAPVVCFMFVMIQIEGVGLLIEDYLKERKARKAASQEPV